MKIETTQIRKGCYHAQIKEGKYKGYWSTDSSKKRAIARLKRGLRGVKR